MTSRLNESSGSNFCTQSDTRPNQVSLSPQRDEEGCPVIEESGTVCGETKTLSIVQDFRAIYDNCMRKMEGNNDDNLALKKLAPFRKLVEDLWEQNAMLVETVEELEQEAANRVTMLQNKLDECSEKVNEYLQDIDSLVEVIQRFRENGKFDCKGLKFNSISDFEIHDSGKSSCGILQETNAKERYRKIAFLQQGTEKSVTRDICTDTNDFGPPEQSKNASASRWRDISPSSIASECYSKSVFKLQSTFEKPEICYKCFATKPNSYCDESSHVYGTPDEELNAEGFWKDNCGSAETNKSSLLKSPFNVTLEEGDENIESFHSAVDCTKEVERRERSDRITVTTTRKFDRRLLNSLKDELINKKHGFDWCVRENEYRGGAASEFANNSITNNLNLMEEHLDIENMLKQKDREICCLKKDLSGKDELLGKYYSQIDELKRDLKARSRKYQQVLNHLKDAAVQRLSKFSVEDLNIDGRELDDGAIEILFNTIFREIDNQKLKFAKHIEEVEQDVKNVSMEKNKILSERSDMRKCLENLRSENSSLRNELACFKSIVIENEGLQNRLEQVKRERDQLLEKVNSLHHNIQELDNNFKETRWALTAEVAEKHDQIQELKRTLVCLEEKIRQADMKALFKDDVIKEMRKELKNSRMSVYTLENVTKVPVQNIPFGDRQSWNLDLPVKEKFEEDLKLDIHIFPLQDNENRKTLTRFKKYFSENICSVEVQTENKKKTVCRTRSVSTQHTTRVQKLPRSFGTLTVTPWSGAGVEGPVCNVDTRIPVDSVKKLQQIHEVPCSNLS